MNNRLTIQELSVALAEYTGKGQYLCEQFLRELIMVISEGVLTDRLVKVKGLGTFKAILVEKRESIHVNTGERFTIPAHYKFSFLPDKELRELVNKPFSFFETTELNENIDFTDLEVSSEQEEKEVENENDVPVEATTVVEEPQVALMEEPIIETVEEKPVEPEKPVEEIPSSPVEELIVETSVTPEKPKEQKETPKQIIIPPREPISRRKHLNNITWKDKIEEYVKGAMVFFLTVLLVGACCMIYMNKSFFVGLNNETTTVLKDSSLPNTTEITGESEPVKEEETPAPETVKEEIIPAETEVQKEEVASTVSEPTDKVLAEIKISSGSRLTLIALQYYGHKIFWVYIYEFNKARIPNPNNIPIGTVIEVPVPELYGIDKNSRTSLGKAAQRQTEILSGS